MDMNYDWGLTRGKEDMEKTDDPMMRLFDDHDAVAAEPLAALARPTSWTGSGFRHSRTFSACGWFFGQALRKALPDVPVGLVEASWSGSPIRTWMSCEAYCGVGRAQKAECEAADRRVAAFRAAGDRAGYGKRLARWKAECDGRGRIPAEAPDFDDSAWAKVALPSKMESHLDKNFDGRVWYRRTFTLDARQAAGGATLRLGTIDDEDTVWINGVRVGSCRQYDRPRAYAVAPGVLLPGENAIAVEAADWKMDGGFTAADPDELAIVPDGGAAVPLAGEWRYRAFRFDPPPVDGDVDFQAPSACYNAMIHPLFPMALKGAIWYQGCADVRGGAAIYGKKFKAMVSDWREHFTHPDGMPIYIVQLASWRETHEEPVESQRAAMRWMQTQLGETIEKSGTAITIDVGAHDDIHPKDKKTVGERLARMALVRTYGLDGIVEGGPIPRSASVVGDNVVIAFGNAVGLTANDGGSLKGFQIVGDDGKAYWADAVIGGENVFVTIPAGVTPAKVRHAWDDYPLCNLVNAASLPCGSFEIEITP